MGYGEGFEAFGAKKHDYQLIYEMLRIWTTFVFRYEWGKEFWSTLIQLEFVRNAV